MNTYDLILDMEYLNHDLVPWSFYFLEKENGSLDACLNEMTPEEQRIRKRKFRKILRKAHRKGPFPKCFWKKQTVVYDYMSKISRKRIKGIKDNDS